MAARVVLLSFDGLGADALSRQSGLPAFARLARESASVRVIPVNPTLTTPAHVALLTGADPQKTGIVSNRFHLPGTPAEQEARGMMIDSDVETLIEAAQRQGKRVGAISFPTIDGRTPRRTADFGLAWSEPVVPGRTIGLKREDFKREWVPPGWTPPPSRRPSFSPVMRARLEWAVPAQTRIDVDVVAYDRSDDRVENYDAIYLESGGFETSPDSRGWFSISVKTSEGLHGSWSKLVRADAALNQVEIYWGPISRNYAYPAVFRDLVDEEAGFWPGKPDESVDPATFSEQVIRLTEFLTRVQTAAIRRMPFDLLLAYYPAIDEASHAHLGKNDDVVRNAFTAADRAIDAVSRLLDLSRDAFIVTGDHGLIAADREVRMNRLIADAGFAPQWRAFTAGNVAQIYGNGDAAPVVKMLTESGHFEKVERKSGTAHRNTGDIVAVAFPNIALTASREPPAIAPRSAGQHGASNAHRELHTILFAVGPGLPSGTFGEIAQTKIARFVAGLLGISPPAAAE